MVSSSNMFGICYALHYSQLNSTAKSVSLSLNSLTIYLQSTHMHTQSLCLAQSTRIQEYKSS